MFSFPIASCVCLQGVPHPLVAPFWSPNAPLWPRVVPFCPPCRPLLAPKGPWLRILRPFSAFLLPFAFLLSFSAFWLLVLPPCDSFFCLFLPFASLVSPFWPLVVAFCLPVAPFWPLVSCVLPPLASHLPCFGGAGGDPLCGLNICFTTGKHTSSLFSSRLGVLTNRTTGLFLYSFIMFSVFVHSFLLLFVYY